MNVVLFLCLFIVLSLIYFIRRKGMAQTEIGIRPSNSSSIWDTMCRSLTISLLNASRKSFKIVSALHKAMLGAVQKLRNALGREGGYGEVL